MKKELFFLILTICAVFLIACGGPFSFQETKCGKGGCEDYIPCEDITDPLNQSLCYYDEAKSKGDLKLCQKVSPEFNGKTPNYQRYPSDSFVALERDINLKDDCLISVAVRTASEEICDLVETSDAKKVCLSEMAIINKNKEFCLKIDEEKLKDFCLVVVGPNPPCEDWEGNSYLQHIYSGGHGKDMCYQGIAFRTGDVEVCQKIELAGRRENCISFLTQSITETCGDNDICYFNTARIQGDTSYCQYIQDSEMKRACENK